MTRYRVGLAVIAAIVVLTGAWAVTALADEAVKIILKASEQSPTASGRAFISDKRLQVETKGLKPDAVYTVWFVNTAPKHEIAGAGAPPYAFTTDKAGTGRFTARLQDSPFGKWEMLVIIRHPTGDPKDMDHKEDALWAPLDKAAAGPRNPCAG